MKKQSVMELLNQPLCASPNPDRALSRHKDIVPVAESVKSLFCFQKISSNYTVPVTVEDEDSFREPAFQSIQTNKVQSTLRADANVFSPSLDTSLLLASPRTVLKASERMAARTFSSITKSQPSIKDTYREQQRSTKFSCPKIIDNVQENMTGGIGNLTAGKSDEENMDAMLNSFRSANTISVSSPGKLNRANSSMPAKNNSLFSGVSNKAIALHCARWEDLARCHAKAQAPAVPIQVTCGHTPTDHIGVNLYDHKDGDSGSESGNQKDSGDVLKLMSSCSPAAAPKGQAISAYQSNSSATDTESIERKNNQILQETSIDNPCAQDARVARWWSAVMKRDCRALQKMTDPESGADMYVRDWYIHKVNTIITRTALLLANNTDMSIENELPSSFVEEYFGMNSLQVLAAFGADDCLEILVQRYPPNCDIDTKDRRWKRTAAVWAATAGSLPCVQILQRAGAALHVTDRSGDSILHKASQADSVELVRWLCQTHQKYGIKLNLRNKQLSAPLLLSRSREVALELLTAGADPAIRNMEGLDIACIAAIRGDAALLEVVLLCNTAYLHKHPSPYQTDVGSTETLHGSRAGRVRMKDNALSLDPVKVNAFNSEVSVKATNANWVHPLAFYADLTLLSLENPLHLAARLGHVECVRTICRLFCSEYAVNSISRTVGDHATSGMARDNIRSPTARDEVTITSVDCADASSGLTPLHIACIFGHAEIVTELLTCGSSSLAENREGANAVTLAAVFGHLHLMPLLGNSAAAINRRGESMLDVFVRLKIARHSQDSQWKMLLPMLDKMKFSDAFATQQESLLPLLLSDQGFVALTLLGANFSPALLRRLTSARSEKLYTLAVQHTSTGHLRPTNAADDNATPTEHEAFLQQDPTKCNVAISFAQNVAEDSVHAQGVKDVQQFLSLPVTPLRQVVYAHRRILARQSLKLQSMIRFVEDQTLHADAAGMGMLQLHLDELDPQRGLQLLWFLYTAQLNSTDQPRSMKAVLDVCSAAPSTQLYAKEVFASEDLLSDHRKHEHEALRLIESLLIADAYFFEGYALCIKRRLIQLVLSCPAAVAPAVFMNADTIGLSKEGGISSDELRALSARQVLLHFSACRSHFRLNETDSQSLLQWCLAAVVEGISYI